ncbi:hypothetical protein [Halomarina pelagica]|uniref:hypothetical protein n=1 Tax=Halomarina pelagica TaxID=2961599 RepID=UPI0020C2F125|nr:hypothetical protein [Halomarina sp. BND7]
MATITERKLFDAESTPSNGVTVSMTNLEMSLDDYADYPEYRDSTWELAKAMGRCDEQIGSWATVVAFTRVNIGIHDQSLDRRSYRAHYSA